MSHGSLANLLLAARAARVRGGGDHAGARQLRLRHLAVGDVRAAAGGRHGAHRPARAGARPGGAGGGAGGRGGAARGARADAAGGGGGARVRAGEPARGCGASSSAGTRWRRSCWRRCARSSPARSCACCTGPRRGPSSRPRRCCPAARRGAGCSRGGRCRGCGCASAGATGSRCPPGPPASCGSGGRGWRAATTGGPGRRRNVRPRPVRRGGGGARLPHGRPGALAAGRHAGVPGARGLPAQGARLPRGAGRGGGRAGRAAAVRECVVVARADAGGEARLVAYLVPEGGGDPAAEELRAALRERLPEHMVPSAFVALDSLPLTPTGKVDRRALPAPEAPAERDGFAAPRTPTEEVLAEVWAAVLGLRRCGVHDDFFAHGGHSLLATRVVSRVRRAFGVDVPVRAVFEAPTPAALAERVERAVEQGRRRGAAHRPGGATRGRCRCRSRSSGSGSWSSWRRGPRRTTSPRWCACPARWTWRRCGARWRRSSAATRGSAPASRSRAASRRRPSPRRDRWRSRWRRWPARRRPGARSRTRRGAPSTWRGRRSSASACCASPRTSTSLLLVVHHAVADGWSLGVLSASWRRCIPPSRRGAPPRCPSPRSSTPTSPSGSAGGCGARRWTGSSPSGGSGWPARRPSWTSPRIFPAPRRRASAAACTASSSRPRWRTGCARSPGARARRSFMALLAAFRALLARYARQDEVVVGSPIAGRTRVEVEGAIGNFVNVAPAPRRPGGRPAVPGAPRPRARGDAGRLPAPGRAAGARGGGAAHGPRPGPQPALPGGLRPPERAHGARRPPRRHPAPGAGRHRHGQVRPDADDGGGGGRAPRPPGVRDRPVHRGDRGPLRRPLRRAAGRRGRRPRRARLHPPGAHAGGAPRADRPARPPLAAPREDAARALRGDGRALPGRRSPSPAGASR